MHRNANDNVNMTLSSAAMIIIILFGLFSTIAINRNGAFATPPEAVNISQPKVFDAQEREVKQLQTGQQVSIRVNITNFLDYEKRFTIITEVRDGLGVTVYLAWHSGKVKPSEHYASETSWMVDNGCWYEKDSGCSNYQIRSFAITGLENPQVLSEVKTVEGGITVIDTASEGSKLYRLEVAGTLQYDIEYSLEGGHITKMDYDVDLATIMVQLYLSRDSMLSIEFPDEIVEYLVCEIPPGGSDTNIEAFVDTIPAKVKEIDNGDSVTWQLELESDAEDVEFVGGGFFP